MPMIATCPDHPEAVVDYTEDVFAHAAECHPGVNVQEVNDLIVRRFVNQATAHGRPTTRIVHCRSCARPTTYTIRPDESVTVYEHCEACRAGT